MNNFSNLPASFYSEESVLDIDSFVRWKKGKGAYNFDRLPQTAIIALSRDAIKPFISPFHRKLKGLLGFNYLYGSKILLCSEFGSGGPAITCFLEELRALGVREFIFVGLGGRLVSGIEEGETFVVHAAHSLNGSSLFYSPNSLLKPITGQLLQNVMRILNNHVCVCLSTDSPFRESPSVIDGYKKIGVSHIEMECAAIYAFSEFYSIPSVCVVVSADSLHGNRWSPPEDMRLISGKQRQVISSLIDSKVW